MPTSELQANSQAALSGFLSTLAQFPIEFWLVFILCIFIAVAILLVHALAGRWA